VWLHAASVGETQSVLTLVRALLQSHPEIHLLITTGTVTSAALVAQQNLARVIHQFVPVDTPQAVRRFLQHWRPDLALWVESEFWPQLLWQAQSARIPMLLINARISQQTYEGWKRWGRTIRSLLAGFETIYAGSAEDASRLMALLNPSPYRGEVRRGAELAQSTEDAPTPALPLWGREMPLVHQVGNLKYDAAPLPIDSKLLEELQRLTAGRPVFVAASTHANEEQSIAEIHPIAAQQFPRLLTIIIPRHAPRGDAIAADLRARGHILAQRSKGEAINADTTIYLADTMGELGNFYALADVVFIGGSLIAHGGQNPLEAARLGRPLITGPYTHNFAAIVAQFVAQHAICVVADKHALADTLIALLQDASSRQQLASRAAELVAQSRGASAHILQHCDAILARGRA
jgi:3-deoxy-D-manno-octulosonic-acid transferase